MKTLRSFVAVFVLLVCAPAYAQWQTPNHSIPIGQGGGISGFRFAAPGTTGQPFVSNGASSDPAFGVITNSGLTPGAADTYKGSLNGTTVTDIPRAPCTGANQALRYTAGGPESCGNVIVQLGYDEPVNLQLNATVASNQLTVAVKGINGSDPSSVNPVQINFRDAASTGTLVTGSLQAALSFTLASTSSMGCTTAVTCRLWVEAICQTISTGACTSILVGLSVQSSANGCVYISEAALQNTGSGTSGGTSGGLIQTSVSALSSKSIRLVGYIEATWVSGTGWSTTPSNVQLFGPGVKKPCERVQIIRVQNGTFGSNAGTYTASATSPTAAAGTVSAQASITPTSVTNYLRITAQNVLYGATNSQQFSYLASLTTVIAVASGDMASGTNGMTLPVTYYGQAGTTSTTTFNLYFTASGGPSYVNGSGSQYFGSISNTFIEVEEIMGALDKPANDNEPLRAVG